jgi:hypothetical protein
MSSALNDTYLHHSGDAPGSGWPSWDGLAGTAIAGRYLLERRLGGDGPAAFFLAHAGEGAARVVVKLVIEEAATAEAQLAAWRAAARLSHPNLLAVLDSGRAGLIGRSADASYLYAVFEFPDDSLLPALERGPLGDAEVSDVARAALNGLAALHEHGMTHGSIDAAHVVAVGDSIKLATDTVRPASAGAGPAADLRALGALLDELLGRPEPDRIPEPLRSVIQHASEPEAGRRRTAGQIAALLDAPIGSSEEPAPPRARLQMLKLPHPPRWIWPSAAAAAGAVLVIVLGMRSNKTQPAPVHPAPAAAPASSAAAPVHPPVPATKAGGQRTSAAEASAHGSRSPTQVPPPSPTTERAAAEPDRIWRVIAYTYNGLSHAENKARTINGKYPQFHAEVFAPRGRNRGPYLVSLGGRKTRAEALRVQQAARAKGLPRDTFVRNYRD